MKQFIKNVLAVVLVFAGLMAQVVFADGTANIKINMSGTKANNSYFLCIPNVGCLSILASTHGKVYPFFQPIQMASIYLMDIDSHFRISPQGLPNSCNVIVKPNQTITISGHLSPLGGGKVYAQGLRCAIS